MALGSDYLRVASELFDGGWREEDREILMKVYDLTEDEVDDIICEFRRFMGIRA